MFRFKTGWIALCTLATPWLQNKVVRAVAVISGVLTARKIIDLMRRKWYNYPPGPVGIPFLGTALSLTDMDYQINCHKYYGPIHMTHFGFANVVFINDIKLLRQLFKKEAFWDRNPLVDTKYSKHGSNYITDFSNLRLSHEWKVRRQLMQLHVIKKLNGSFLTNILTKIIKNNVLSIVDNNIYSKKSNKENIWYVRNECCYIAFATVYSAVFGDSCPKPNDLLFTQFKNKTNQMFNSLPIAVSGSLLFPFNKQIEQWIVDKSNYASNVIELQNIIRKWIKQYNNYNNNNNNNNNKNEPRDDINRNRSLYYQVLKDAISNKTDNSGNDNQDNDMINIDHECITEDSGIADIFVAFIGGTHTTAVALEQCILYLAKCGQSLQNELYNEICPFIIPTVHNNNDDDDDGQNYNYDYNYDAILKNCNKLDKLGSFIYEVLRIHGFIFSTANRQLIKKEEIIEVNMCIGAGKNNDYNGIKTKRYVLPKNCTVFGNVAAINHDVNIWEKKLKSGNIFEFNPKRFIDSKTNKMKHGKDSIKSYMITFGAGRRNCPGKELAIKELYLVMAIFISRYIFKIPNKYIEKQYNIPRMFVKSTTPTLGVVVEKRTPICKQYK